MAALRFHLLNIETCGSYGTKRENGGIITIGNAGDNHYSRRFCRMTCS